jgi:hypothetical protein
LIGKRDGQIVIGAIILLVILAIFVPALIKYTENESFWTVKEQRTTSAFQLAESAVERGFQTIILSTGVWNSIQAGGTIPGYNFDQVYADLAGGVYEIKISQGPGIQQATIFGIGKDSSSKEIRAIKVIQTNSASQAALYAQGGITLNNPSVEWGPVLSPNQIVVSQDHPRFYSSSNIVGLDPNGAVPPNSDNVQWWSYYPALPPPPQVDLQAYLSSATSQGHVYAGGAYSMRDDICGGAASCSGVYYFTGNTTLKTPAATIANGAIVVVSNGSDAGSLTIQGSAGSGSYPTATLPADAWKEYGNDWNYYRTNFDPGAPATFPGVNGSYPHGTLTASIINILVHGLLYVKNQMNITGGGNTAIWGNMYVGDSSTLDGSHIKLYYDNGAVYTKNVSLLRTSWNEVGGCDWSGTHPTCS